MDFATLIIGGMLPQLRLLDKLQIRPAPEPISRTCRRIDEKMDSESLADHHAFLLPQKTA